MLELARPEDWKAVNRIKGQIHRLHVDWRPDIFCMADELYPEAFFLEDIQNKRLYVAKIDGQVLGYLRIRFRQYSGEGMVSRQVLELEEIAVEETCRGQGIGTEMMVDVMALAKAFGCTDMQLSVYPQNEAGLALYRKFGFTIRCINMQRKV